MAIKFLHPSLSEDEDCRMRFPREARAARGLSHPHIVVVHDVGEIERRPHMAMELVDGEPLSELLRRYMSPEQTRGDKVDGRSDPLSVGIVTCQMLAGERPGRGDSLEAVAAKISNEAPPPLATLNPEVPASLRRVVDRCLGKQPHRH